MRFMWVFVVDRCTHTCCWSCKGRRSLRVKYNSRDSHQSCDFKCPYKYECNRGAFRMRSWWRSASTTTVLSRKPSSPQKRANVVLEPTLERHAWIAEHWCNLQELGWQFDAILTYQHFFSLSWVRFYEIITEAFEASTFSFFIVFDQVMLLLYISVHPSKSHNSVCCWARLFDCRRIYRSRWEASYLRL